MHQAPALALTLPPDRLWRGGIRTLAVSALLAASLWLAWHALQTSTPIGHALLPAALSSLPALWLLRSTGTAAAVGGCLSWCPDEARWTLQRPSSNGQDPPRRSGRIDCVADGIDWMLLRHTARGLQPVWLRVSRRDQPDSWHALRCTVFSPGARPEPATASDE
jgi:hypothetical protein